MVSSAVVAFAGRVLSGFDSEPIMATGGHIHPCSKTPPPTHTHINARAHTHMFAIKPQSKYEYTSKHTSF